ncbi:MAG: hypothetical protein Q7T20_03040 [Saprospiraceae bacterium]|nr:hypothetical protein [Saprospiraceae bacterium]
MKHRPSQRTDNNARYSSVNIATLTINCVTAPSTAGLTFAGSILFPHLNLLLTPAYQNIDNIQFSQRKTSILSMKSAISRCTAIAITVMIAQFSLSAQNDGYQKAGNNNNTQGNNYATPGDQGRTPNNIEDEEDALRGG